MAASTAYTDSEKARPSRSHQSGQRTTSSHHPQHHPLRFTSNVISFIDLTFKVFMFISISYYPNSHSKRHSSTISFSISMERDTGILSFYFSFFLFLFIFGGYLFRFVYLKLKPVSNIFRDRKLFPEEITEIK